MLLHWENSAHRSFLLGSSSLGCVADISWPRYPPIFWFFAVKLCLDQPMSLLGLGYAAILLVQYQGFCSTVQTTPSCRLQKMAFRLFRLCSFLLNTSSRWYAGLPHSWNINWSCVPFLLCKLIWAFWIFSCKTVSGNKRNRRTKLCGILGTVKLGLYGSKGSHVHLEWRMF